MASVKPRGNFGSPVGSTSQEQTNQWKRAIPDRYRFAILRPSYPQRWRGGGHAKVSGTSFYFFLPLQIILASNHPDYPPQAMTQQYLLLGVLTSFQYTFFSLIVAGGGGADIREKQCLRAE
jgi:hypothetical protein